VVLRRTRVVLKRTGVVLRRTRGVVLSRTLTKLSEQNPYKTIEDKTNQKVLSAKESAKEKEGGRRWEGYEWLLDP
jgi:hypothetical protein